MIVGLEKTVAREANSTTTSRIWRTVLKVRSPWSMAAANCIENPLGEKLNMLVPINGTENSRRAAEVAIAIARVSHAPLTALLCRTWGQKPVAPLRGSHPERHRETCGDL